MFYQFTFGEGPESFPNLAFHSIPILFTSPCDFLLFIWMAEMA